MRFIADLHIHSKYSRATSKNMSPESIWKWASPSGLFSLKKEFRTDDVPDSCSADVFFLLTAEISCIYGKNRKTRKVHSIVLAPDFADAARINTALSKIGNIKSDGRPILGLDTKELLKIVKDASPDAELIPAHAWTPHFSVFGAVSGFDSLEECFEDLTPYVFAIETGLSSDPPMNRRLSALDGITLISNSDACTFTGKNRPGSKYFRYGDILQINYERAENRKWLFRHH
jgi:PHP family Zn ribbon phosphoesterase